MTVAEGIELDRLAQIADKTMKRSNQAEVTTIALPNTSSQEPGVAEITKSLLN